MFKDINWKFVFRCFAWVLCLCGVVVLMSFISMKKNTVTITNVKILIPGADNFIEREEIDAVLKQSQGSLIGQKLENINLHAIEKKIISNPYIARAIVFADMDGVIHIQITQRQPILRVINAGGQDYYIDRDGLKMPVSPNFTANVLVANGNIMERFSGRVDTLITKLAADLYETAKFIKRDTLWDSQIEQLFVDDKMDIELIPRVGNQRILLGSADSLQVKMRNLLAFYKQAMPKVGWDTYKTINIKYTNQVVCEKNKPDSQVVNGVKRPTISDTAKAAKGAISALVLQQIAKEMKNDAEDPDVPDGSLAVASSKPPAEKPVIKPAAKKVETVKPTVKKTEPKPKPKAKPVVSPAKKTASLKKSATDPVKKTGTAPPVKKATTVKAGTKTAKVPAKKPATAAEKK
ncbi:cell division protein FtsQ/DivIB [Pedobacter gandavensis]|uniref:cell division protein FtsQ/DivIB n=1 Tax=Pedobacter gandavensis TaxID=2679963 RepID=UPI001F386C06|nr:cell division protein FtsQ [Pedobacter gandavensis]